MHQEHVFYFTPLNTAEIPHMVLFRAWMCGIQRFVITINKGFINNSRWTSRIIVGTRCAILLRHSKDYRTGRFCGLDIRIRTIIILMINYPNTLKVVFKVKILLLKVSIKYFVNFTLSLAFIQ